MAENTVAGVLCPHCRADLVMSERQGVEIDYCPKCRGVWLDRGELDKILERAAAYEAQMQQPAAPPPQAPTAPWGNPSPYPASPGHSPQPGYHGDYGDYRGGHHGERKRRHKSFLEDIFD